MTFREWNFLSNELRIKRLNELIQLLERIELDDDANLDLFRKKGINFIEGVYSYTSPNYDLYIGHMKEINFPIALRILPVNRKISRKNMWEKSKTELKNTLVALRDSYQDTLEITKDIIQKSSLQIEKRVLLNVKEPQDEI